MPRRRAPSEPLLPLQTCPTHFPTLEGDGSERVPLAGRTREFVSLMNSAAFTSMYSAADTFAMAEDELLREIRESFVSDGVRWAVEPERKLIHLWKKLKRTEDYLRKSAQETEALKAQQKGDMNNVQELLANVRRLGEEKDALTHSLEEENGSLRERCEQAEAERNAFIEENQVIAKCLVEAGLQRFAGPSPRQPVELLIKERQELQHRLTKLEGEAATNRQQAAEQEAALERKVKELESSSRDTESRLGQEISRVKASVKEKEALEEEVYISLVPRPRPHGKTKSFVWPGNKAKVYI